jgi:hypothetical protein
MMGRDFDELKVLFTIFLIGSVLSQPMVALINQLVRCA